MKQRSVKQIIDAAEITEGAGVTVFRSIGISSMRNLDPFLMLDHMGSDNPDEYLAGFPNHPHRGFITLTYMLEGHMEHQDSMGNKGQLRSGGAQWMKAASGVIHSEMPKQVDGIMSGFQLWINLPAKEKMTDPAYQEFSSEAIAELDEEGVKVRALSGSYHFPSGAEITGPIVDEITQLHYLDVKLESDKVFRDELKPDLTSFIYVIKGEINLSSEKVSAGQFIALTEGNEVNLTSADAGAHFILVAGKAINEPIVQHGPFVMNTEEEINQAIKDYREGTLVQTRADFITA